MVDDGRARLNSSAHTYWARSIAGRDKYLRDHQQAPGSRRRGIHVRPERHGGLGPAGAGSGEATGSPPTRPGSSISRGQPGVRSPARRGAWARAGGEPRTPRASRAGSLLPVLEPGGQLRPRSPPLSRTPERQEPPGGFVIAPYIAADSCHLLCLVTTPRRSLFRWISLPRSLSQEVIFLRTVTPSLKQALPLTQRLRLQRRILLSPCLPAGSRRLDSLLAGAYRQVLQQKSWESSSLHGFSEEKNLWCVHHFNASHFSSANAKCKLG